MAEIQQATTSSDLTQRFIELVMMNAQQAALCLGQMARPSTGKSEINLNAARMFIDHLEIIREKTRGNLNKDEDKILSSVLSELQLAYVQVAESTGAQKEHIHDENCSHAGHEDSQASTTDSLARPESPSEHATETEDPLGKKKFSKSYGA